MAFPLEIQEMTLWCWAAVSLSIDKFFDQNSARSQCDIAESVVGGGCCGNRAACNSAQNLDEALDSVGKLYRMFEFSLSYTDLAAQLDAKFPVCVRIGWFGGGGHFVTVSACRITGGQRIVTVEDPKIGRINVRYENFVSAYRAGEVAGGGAWTHSYLTKDGEADV
jgi:hypothetical protein